MRDAVRNKELGVEGPISNILVLAWLPTLGLLHGVLSPGQY